MIQLGSAGDFGTVRDALERSGFTEAEICRRFGIASLDQFEVEADRPQMLASDTDAAGVLVRLFVEGRYTDVSLLTSLLGTDALQSMSELGMLEHDPDAPDQIAATVGLYQTSGIYIVSDRWNRPDRGPFRPAPDVVYPAIVSNTQRFLRYMPRHSCERMLDLGAGTGIATLIGARDFARQAFAFDIAPRSTLFSEFNRRLNDIDNVTTATGDLYAPAGDVQFDRIVSHPPYVPVLRPKWIYHDGGEDGEQIVRRVISGLSGHLAPGGLFYLLAMVSDRKEEPFEKRVRRWLDDSSDEFDVLMCPLNSLDPDDFAVRAALGGENPTNDLAEFRRLIRSLGVTEMLYTGLFIQRRAESRSVFTVRRQATGTTTGADMLFVLDFETQLQTPAGIEGILGARLRPNRETELRVQHQLGDSGWEIAQYILRASRPFSMEARTDPWAPFLIALADGARTLREYLDELKQQGAVPPDVPPHDFARAAGSLISGGFLQLEQ
jgi:SAM-dependent methyltransferase